VTTAWRTAREVGALTRSAALAYAYAGNGDDAYAALASLALPSRDDPMARWARQWQARLETGVSRGDILAEMRAPAPTDGPFKEWTLEKENVVREMGLIVGLESVAASNPENATRLLAEASLRRARMNRSAGTFPAEGR